MNLWKTQRFTALASSAVIEEYLEVLRRFSIPSQDMEEFISLFTDPSRTNVVVPKVRVRRILDDPDDDKFLECALAGDADAIVSGDKHLKKLKSFHNILIFSPMQFLMHYGF